MNWVYNDKEITDINDFPENCIGFVYRIIYINDKFYIGQKSLYRTMNVPVGKRSIGKITDSFKKRRNGKLVEYHTVKKESNWKLYNGSFGAKDSLEIRKKEIIAFCYKKIHLLYKETKYLFAYNALENDMCLNTNILGKFYKSNIT